MGAPLEGWGPGSGEWEESGFEEGAEQTALWGLSDLWGLTMAAGLTLPRVFQALRVRDLANSTQLSRGEHRGGEQ